MMSYFLFIYFMALDTVFTEIKKILSSIMIKSVEGKSWRTYAFLYQYLLHRMDFYINESKIWLHTLPLMKFWSYSILWK